MLSSLNRCPSAVAAAVPALILSLALAAPGPARAQFIDDFSGPGLDPAWQVVAYTGPFPRAHGFTSPANDFSVTANPGHLRYVLQPMTHADGFFLGYPTTAGYHSCCTHDPGLELHRTFSGDQWALEAKGSVFLPFTNGRAFELRVYFGDGTAPTYLANFIRGRDVNQNYIELSLHQKTGSGLDDRVALVRTFPGSYPAFFPIFGGPDLTTVYWRLQRSGGLLSSQWSLDGTSWTTAFSYDLGSQLDGLDQRVVVTGASWFNTAGSYADWDYVAVVPTLLPIVIDVKPGSDANSVNPGSRGVIPVAVLTTATAAGDPADFDAAELDPATVGFGPAGAVPAHSGGHLEDVDGDGDLDRIFHFRTAETGIACGDTAATLTGETLAGQPVEGTDAVRTVGCR